MDISGFHEKDGRWIPYVVCSECTRLWRLCVWENIEKHLRAEHSASTKKKTFAFTFTTNKDTKLEIQKDMCCSAWKLFQQKTIPVEEGEVYLEYTEQGRPHLHGWYVTEDGGRIFAKVFHRCWPSWGEKARQTKFAGGYHELMKTNRYIGYASSEARLVVSKKKDADAVYFGETADKWHI